MSTKRYVLDPADDWGRIPSHLLDRGAFFLTPDPSEEGVLVDEEYDQENIWDRQEKKVQEDEKVQEDFIIPSLDLEKIGPHVSLEEKCHGNPSKVSESMEEIRDKKTNSDKKYVEIKVIEVGDCELIKDEVSSSYIEDPIPPIFIANSKKGRRYSEDFKKEVREYSKTHSVRETMQFFDITKTSVQRWKLVKDEVELPVSIQEELKHMNNDENERYKRHDHGHQFNQHNSDLSMIFIFKNCESINNLQSYCPDYLFSKCIYF